MSNEQLLVLLNRYYEQLSTAIARSREFIPIEMVTKTAGLFGQELESVPVLDPFYNMLDSLEKDMETLEKGKK